MQCDSEAAMRHAVGPPREGPTRGEGWHRRCLQWGRPSRALPCGADAASSPNRWPEGGLSDMHRKILATLVPGVLALVLGAVACNSDETVGPEGPGADALMGGGKPPKPGEEANDRM